MAGSCQRCCTAAETPSNTGLIIWVVRCRRYVAQSQGSDTVLLLLRARRPQDARGPGAPFCFNSFYFSFPVLSGVCIADEQAQVRFLLALTCSRKGSWHIA